MLDELSLSRLYKKAPKYLSDQMILLKTYYDKMSNEERDLVFKAYSFNRSKELYELTNPEHLNQEIIRKLV